jgi:hypothetical protein
MLEATIGLNELNSKESDGAISADEEGDASDRTSFTSNDLSFLKSLRISVEGDEGPDSDTDTK